MACSHLPELASKLKPPSPSQQVHREECTLCFDGQDDPEGVLVCMTCFNGGCFGEGRRHAFLHFEKTGHQLGLVVKRTRKEMKKRDSQEPPAKRLAITAPADEELYSYSTSLRCFGCSTVGEAVHSDDFRIHAVEKGIMSALSSSQQSEVKAWEEEILACEHTLTLGQEPLINIGQLPTQCTECDLTSNLWLCLTCGLANCGRQQFGGVGGNGHALQHFHDTGHAVGVKLGTITPEGTADIYCYSCDDAKLDPDLPRHLQAFGIAVLGQTKTEKSMTELQLEHNLKFDFSMTGDDGRELQPIFGPALTGLKNLGNSCYMASVIQTLLTLPAFRTRYHTELALSHLHTCDNALPATCLECQMLKLADGLISGRYSRLAPAPPVAASDLETPETPKFQEGIKPSQFKALIGKGHEEFATMRQQDSEEFLQHLLTRLRVEAKRQGRDESQEATDALRFGTEQRLQCSECRRVGYMVEAVDLASLPVEAVEKGLDKEGRKLWEEQSLEGCIAAFCAPEELADYACGHCGKKVKAEKSTRFMTFPDVLVLHMKKFQLVNWVPTKLDIPIRVPETLRLDQYLGKGRQQGEEELDVDAKPGESRDSFLDPHGQHNADIPASSEPEVNAQAMSQLEAMGFPTVRCQKALLATGNGDAEMAMAWLFEHMEDSDIDTPIQATSSAAAGVEPTADQIAMIADMGFSTNQARKALRQTDGNPERAIEWLFSNPDDPGEDVAAATMTPVDASAFPDIGGKSSLPANYRLKAFISHKGPSVHSGHYVATIRQPQAGVDASEGSEEWVLFNDEKVVRAGSGGGEELRGLAYLYVYERV